MIQTLPDFTGEEFIPAACEKREGEHMGGFISLAESSYVPGIEDIDLDSYLSESLAVELAPDLA